MADNPIVEYVVLDDAQQLLMAGLAIQAARAETATAPWCPEASRSAEYRTGCALEWIEALDLSAMTGGDEGSG